MDRRTFIKGTGIVALAGTAFDAQSGRAQGMAPNSSGTGAPKLKAPANACDCHHHIYDTRFPFGSSTFTVPSSSLADYLLLQRRLRTTRSVIVTPAPFPATFADNLVTLDAIKKLSGKAVGVAIISPDTTGAELKALHDQGIRGIRFSIAAAPLSGSNTRSKAADMIEPLSKRVNSLGWHVQINMSADQIVAAGDLWNRLPTPLVFDHMGHMPQPMGIEHPAFNILRNLVDKGRTWVKLSVTFDSSKVGPPTYDDVNKVGRALVQAAPERVVWGSNWPHPNETNKPDDAMLFDLLAAWAPNEATRHRILVENPEKLYGFPNSR